MAKKKSINLDQFFSSAPGDDLTFLIGATAEQAVSRAADLGYQFLQLPTEAIAPDPDQLRHLPHPNELVRLEASGDQAAATVLTGLRELGKSMQEHGQIQPVIVYPVSDADAPVTHRLLNGHRRWSAALLFKLPQVAAIEVPRPSEMTRLIHQFEENERREGFSDMERAWALVTMKDALQQEAGGEVPWEVLEDQLQISTSRRQDLLRLLRFSAEGQALIMRYGWSEWTLRPLHMAINRASISPDQGTELLRALARTPDVTVSTVIREVERVYQPTTNEQPASDATTTAQNEQMNTQRELLLVSRRMVQLRQQIQQLYGRVSAVNDRTARDRIRQEADALRSSLELLITELGAGSK